jgi:hypothetical protein
LKVRELRQAVANKLEQRARFHDKPCIDIARGNGARPILYELEVTGEQHEQ